MNTVRSHVKPSTSCKKDGAECFVLLGDGFDKGNRSEETVRLVSDMATLGVWGHCWISPFGCSSASYPRPCSTSIGQSFSAFAALSHALSIASSGSGSASR